MFKKLFGKRVPAAPDVLVTIQLNARLQPTHRHELFEDPIEQFMDERKLGEICGGGTALSNDGEVEYGDIELALFTKESIGEVINVFEKLGAPKGSKIRFYSSDHEISFGVCEGLGLYLNGTDLPDDVYAQCDSNHVHKQVSELIRGHGEILSHWQGPTETALYLYGESFVVMRSKIQAFLESYPLCQHCRVVQIA